MSPPRIGWRDHLVGVALCVSYVAVLLASSAALGMSRDEGFYVDAANRYGQWFELLGEDSSVALTQESIDAHWHVNHEHPSLVKSMFAFFHLAQQKWELFETPSMAYRFFGMLTGGLLLWLIYIFGARVFGRQVGAFAALAFALMPRVFYHAQLDCFDVPIVLMMTLVAYCYWRSLSDARWAIVTVIVYGLCLETKHNAWTLPAIFWLHWVFMAGRRWAKDGAPGGWWGKSFFAVAVAGPLLAFGLAFFTLVLVPVIPLPLVNVGWVGLVALPLYLGGLYLLARKAGVKQWRRYVPVAWLAMVIVGPMIFVALWPWMWFDTALRFREYAAFHLNHTHYNMVYFGVNYFAPPLPVGYPWVMTLFTVPLATLGLALAGIASRARAIAAPTLLSRFWPSLREDGDASCTDVLMVGLLFAPLVVISMPWTPIFGGTKHWFSAYPFVAIYAGVAFVYVVQAARERIPERAKRAWLQYAAPVAIGGVLLAPSVIETRHSEYFGLSHYTFAAGGVPGAADHGMNRQFWGFTTGSLAGWFNEQMPSGGTVYPCDTTWTAWRMLQEDGLLHANIRPVADMPSADYAIVHHEHHFVEVDYQIWAAWGSVQPVYVLTYDGVPIVSVYENPQHAERRAQIEPVR